MIKISQCKPVDSFYTKNQYCFVINMNRYCNEGRFIDTDYRDTYYTCWRIL